MFIILNYNLATVSEDNIYEATRHTQQVVISDSVNIGDYIVNERLSIDHEIAIKKWVETFQENNDLNVVLVIDVIDVLDNPPAIAVKIRGYTHVAMLEKDLILQYENVILIEKN